MRTLTLCFLLLLGTPTHAAEPPRLVYSIGMSDGAVDTDGVIFRIEVTATDGSRSVLAEDLWAERRWKQLEVSLAEHDGKEVLLRFVADPGATTTYDWACWGEPRILRGDDVLLDFSAARIWRSGVIVDGQERSPMSPEETGASFRLGERTCGGVRRQGFFSHPPWKGDDKGGFTFAEYRVFIGDGAPRAVTPDLLPAPPPESSPFPMGKAPCFRLPSPVTVDGKTDDWPESIRRAPLVVRQREQMAVERVSYKPGWKAGWTGPRDVSAGYYVGWDNTALYIAEVRRDDKLLFMDSMSRDFSGSDSLRICLSRSPQAQALGQGDAVIAILPEGEQDQPMVRVLTYDAELTPELSPADVHVAPSLFAGGWVMEVRVPFSGLGVEPRAGTTLGFQLIVTDSDTPMDRHYELTWSPKQSSEYDRVPREFGTLTLCNESFAWVGAPRTVYAQGEAPALDCGAFSLRPQTVGSASVQLRTPQGNVLPGHETSGSLQSRFAATCPALSSLGSQQLEYSISIEPDSFTGTIPLDVVRDRGDVDLTTLAQPASPTVMPSVASSAFRNTARRDGQRIVLEYEGQDERIRYVVSPGVGFDVEMWSDDVLLCSTNPAETGPVSGTQAGSELAEGLHNVRLTDGLLSFSCTLKSDSQVEYRMEIRGKTLLTDVASTGTEFTEFRGPLHGMRLEEVSIPYLEPRMGVHRLGRRFVSSYADWTVTGASALRRLGSTSYAARTDGTRNPLRERVLLTTSRELLEVLPNLPNPVSPFLDTLSDRIVLDCWSFGSHFSDFGRYLEALKGYGVEGVAIIFHVWQRHGYDNGLPEHVPANPGLGGDEEMRALGATAKRLGYLFSLHENYIDYYPNYPQYTEDAVARDPAGGKVDAWYMPSTGIQSYRLKPSWIERYVRDQSPQVHSRYSTTAAYLDVHSVNLPFHMDFDAKAPGAASFGYSLETITWLFEFMRDTHGGPLFGEGNYHAAWAGRIDGCEAQIGGRGGEARPVLVDFDLLKVHPLAVNHGMGYYSRWHRTRSGRLTDQEMDKYRSQEIAYGHAGFLNTGMMPNLTQTLREYFMVRPLQARYSKARAIDIRYQLDGDGWVGAGVACRASTPRRVRVIYDNGLELWVNDGRGEWDASGVRLPPYGFVARGAGIDASTALYGDGLVGDFCETPEVVFVDPRTYQATYTDEEAIVDIEPLQPKLVPKEDGDFEITYRWSVRQVPDRDYTAFVHYTDANGRILWQNDHWPGVTTSAWEPGGVYEDGPHSVTVPDHVGAGTYDIRVGLFIPRSGRLALKGHDAGGNSYLTGRLRVERRPHGGRELAFVPPPPPRRTGTGRNPAGSTIDFGKVATDMTLRIEKGETEIRLMPIPHGQTGRVVLRLGRLLAGKAGRAARVEAIGSRGEVLGAVESERAGAELAFAARRREAWEYRVRVP